MKRMIIFLAATLILSLVAFIGCNSSNGPSQNKEGLVELTGPRK